jgi:hypothetical protein
MNLFVVTGLFFVTGMIRGHLARLRYRLAEVVTICARASSLELM